VGRGSWVVEADSSGTSDLGGTTRGRRSTPCGVRGPLSTVAAGGAPRCLPTPAARLFDEAPGQLPSLSPRKEENKGRPKGGHPGERGRKKSAPTVDTTAYLPTLSLPLQGGDSGPTVSVRGSVSFLHRAHRSPLCLSPRKATVYTQRNQAGATELENASLTGSPSFLSPRAAPDHDFLRRRSRQRGSRHEGSL
jgi:hypothetical protein